MDIQLVKLLLEEQTNKLHLELGISPYSREFVFGSSERYTKERNNILYFDHSGPQTLLRGMLRYGLTESRAQALFPTYFDLGSAKDIPDDRKTLVELARSMDRKERSQRKDLSAYRSRSSDADHIKKRFESITTALKAYTGLGFRDYPDKQNSLRVVKLIATLMADPNMMNEGRGRKLLSFIKRPDQKFSFETRGAHPVSGLEGNTYLLSDLKSYLCIELPFDETERIDKFCYQIFDRVKQIQSRATELAFQSGKHGLVLQTLDSQIAATQSFLPSVDASDVANRRLDLDLYLHLSKLDFLHFAGAFIDVQRRSQRMPRPRAIVREITTALSTIKNKNVDEFHTRLDDFWIDDIPTILRDQKQTFLALVASSIEHTPSAADYERSIEMVRELLFRRHAFTQSGFFTHRDTKVSFEKIVTALVACCESLHTRTEFRANIVGDNTQSRSVVTKLEKKIVSDIGGYGAGEPFSESYLQLWDKRLDFVHHCIQGSPDIGERHFLLRETIFSKVTEILDACNVTQADLNLCRLEERLLEAAMSL